MAILAIIAIIVIPPEKLPEVARQVARFFSDLRRTTSGVWDDIKKDAVFKPEDLLKPTPPRQPSQAFNPPTFSTEIKPDSTIEVKSEGASEAKPEMTYEQHIAVADAKPVTDAETKKDE